MSEWISVKERMPNCGVNVWVVYHGVVQYIAYALDDVEWLSATGEDSMPLSFVTHWMPMPKPPATEQAL